MTSSLIAQGLAIPGRLEPTSLAIAKSSLVAVVGPNGGGKTSLLRALARVDTTQGSVTIDGELLDPALPSRRAKLVAFLPASHLIAWPIPVGDFLELGGATASSISREMSALDLAPLAERPMNQLSTGQRSRAMIGRALASDARMLLLDEPLSNLDPYWTLRTLDILRQRASAGVIAIVTLHDLAQLAKVDRALVMDRGTLIADSPPQALLDGDLIEAVFGVRMEDGVPVIRQRADPRSSR
jgi:iron complex transport system ATP-binding protein